MSLRIDGKKNFEYAKWDAVVLRKHFSSILKNPLNFFCNAPKNVVQIFSFYLILLISIILFLIFFFTYFSLFTPVFLFIPSIIGSIKIFSNRKNIPHKNPTILITGYAFLAIFVFSIIKGIGFLIGLMGEKNGL